MLFKLRIQDSPSSNPTWKSSELLFTPIRTPKKNLLHLKSKPSWSKIIFLTTFPSLLNWESSRSHLSQIWPSSGLTYVMYRVVKTRSYLSTDASMWAITLLRSEESTWTWAFPSAKIAGNGTIPLSHVISKRPNVLSVTVPTNQNITENLVGVAKLTPRLTPLD